MKCQCVKSFGFFSSSSISYSATSYRFLKYFHQSNQGP